MSILILDKDTNKQNSVTAGEANNRNPPTFTGTGSTQDPLKFLEEFEKFAEWNNWSSDERKKETFLLCLSGHAERWVKNHLMVIRNEFNNLEFDDGSEDCLLSKFKNYFITDEWFEIYTKQYEDRVQIAEETPLKYMKEKRYLLKRAGPTGSERTAKQQVGDILNGLLPQVKRFCDEELQNPFNTTAKSTLDTLDDLEMLLRRAEERIYEDGKVVPLATSDQQEAVSAMVRRKSENSQSDQSYHSGQNNNESCASENRNHNSQGMSKNSDLERQVLGKLDTIENDIATLRDRVDLSEKSRNSSNDGGLSSVEYGQGSYSTSRSRCYSCDKMSHFARECNMSCNTCERQDHTSVQCPKQSQNEESTKVMTKMLPNEVLGKIAYFAGSRVALAIGLELDREILFLDKGIAHVLGDILAKDADIRSLFRVKNYITPHLAIHRAVSTENITIVKRVCIIWNSLSSELGYVRSYHIGFSWGIENLKTVKPLDTVMLNRFYVRTKEYNKLDLTIDKPFGDSTWEFMTKDFIPDNLRYPDITTIWEALDVYYKERNMEEIHKILDSLLELNPPIKEDHEELSNVDNRTNLEEMLVDVMDGSLDPENSMIIFNKCIDSGHITYDRVVYWAIKSHNVDLLRLLDFEHKELYFMLVNNENTEKSCSMYRDYIQRDEDTFLQMLMDTYYIDPDEPGWWEDDIDWGQWIDLEVRPPAEKEEESILSRYKRSTIFQKKEIIYNREIDIHDMLYQLDSLETLEALRILVELYGLDILDSPKYNLIHLRSGNINSAWFINLCLDSGRKLPGYKRISCIRNGKLEIGNFYLDHTYSYSISFDYTRSYLSSDNIHPTSVDHAVAIYMYVNGLYSIVNDSLL